MTDTSKHNTALSDLVKLPNGNWIDPLTVLRIQYMAPAAGFGYRDGGAGDRVRVDLIGGGYEFMEFDDAIAAVEFRDGMAAKANEAKAAVRAALKEAHHG